VRVARSEISENGFLGELEQANPGHAGQRWSKSIAWREKAACGFSAAPPYQAPSPASGHGSPSSTSQGRFPRATGCSQANLDPHLAEHVLHVRSHMIRDYRPDLVLSEETSDAGVVPALGSGIVEASPADVELVPALDRVPAHVGDRHPLRATPTRIHEAVLRNREADDHSESLHRTARRMDTHADLGASMTEQAG